MSGCLSDCTEKPALTFLKLSRSIATIMASSSGRRPDSAAAARTSRSSLEGEIELSLRSRCRSKRDSAKGRRTSMAVQTSAYRWKLEMTGTMSALWMGDSMIASKI